MRLRAPRLRVGRHDIAHEPCAGRLVIAPEPESPCRTEARGEVVETPRDATTGLWDESPTAASRGASTTSPCASVLHGLSGSGSTTSCPARGSGATPCRPTLGPRARSRFCHQQQIGGIKSSKKESLGGKESFSLGSNHITTCRRPRFTTEKDTRVATGTAATMTGVASSAGSRPSVAPQRRCLPVPPVEGGLGGGPQ